MGSEAGYIPSALRSTSPIQRVVGLGRDSTLHGTYEFRSCPFPLGRPVSRKAGKTKLKLFALVAHCQYPALRLRSPFVLEKSRGRGGKVSAAHTLHSFYIGPQGTSEIVQLRIIC